MSLAPFGSACRCLLRVREDLGRAYLSDEDFVRAHLERFPGWRCAPGAVDAAGLAWVATQLGVAVDLVQTRSYERVLDARAGGRAVLVHTDAAPRPDRPGPAHATTSLLLDMDATGFRVWWPDPRGPGEHLPRLDRAWWERWGAMATILIEQTAPPPPRLPATEGAA